MSWTMILALLGVALIGAGGVVLTAPKEFDGMDGTPLPAFLRFDPLFRQYGAAYGVPWLWLKAFAMNESSLGQDSRVARGLEVPTDVEGSKSRDGKSWGLMQVTLPTAQAFDPAASAELLNDPDYCVDIAAQLVRELADHFPVVMGYPMRLEAIAKAYNEGEGNERTELDGGTPPRKADAQAYWERWKRNYAALGADPNTG